ncbi:MAG: uroporphyrinogen-III synthase [Betaproteobacteria bacterium]|jgi:uroporphyrinogen-III synthase|nr:uroporphyrinogen-III synthase [Betaproteobacteria bacterium]
MGELRMRHVWMIRPEWSEPALMPAQAEHHGDARLKAMPLQRLEVLHPDTAVLQVLNDAACPWIVWTSPAAVSAFFFWLKRHGVDTFFLNKVRLAVIASGTRDQLLRLYPEAGTIIVAEQDERADAEGLLSAMDRCIAQESSDWARQTLLIVEGESNRPTLRAGFEARGAHALLAVLYRRIASAWPESAWAEIAGSDPGGLGLVVTSSAAGRQLISAFQARGIALSQVIWCTHHAAIAELLQSAGATAVRRVRLNHQWLSYDLFEHEAHW